MSGPVTLEYLLIQGAIMGAKAAIDGLRNARDAADRADSARTHRSRERRAAELAGARTLADRIAALESNLARLASLAASLAPALAASGIPLAIETPPRAADVAPSELAAHAARLEAALARAEADLRAAGAALAREGDAALDAATLDRLVKPRSLEELFDAYRRAQAEARAADLAVTWRGEIDRLLAPLGAADALPQAIERVVRELASPASDARAQSLALELRRLVGDERLRRDQVERDRDAAEKCLAELDEMALERETPPSDLDAVRQRLALVCARLLPLDEPLAKRARSLAAEMRREREAATRAAAADVLEGTLKDLGFVVEPIADTLFVAGGVAHFTRPDWGDYAVRLRANATDGTLNFNVIREEGSDAADALSTRLRDMAAEERWCAHIPKLSETLAARGIQLDVRRRLGAGEAPAQVVPKGTLDRIEVEERSRAQVPERAQGAAP